MAEKKSGMTQKDYMGEKLRLAERAQEESYFRKVNEELLAALRTKDAEALAQAIRQHVHMRCPKCGESLQELPYRQIKVDECGGCHGIWLDRGELETLVGPKEGRWLQRFYEAFMPAKR